MADLSILAGSTSQSILVDLYILATGAPQTGLVYNSSGLTAYYSFAGAVATSTAITLATLASVTAAWGTGGFIKLDDTNMPGIYRFDIPNAVLAAAKGREVIVTFNGYSGMAARHIKIELTGWDNQNGNSGGLANLDTNVGSRMATYTQPTGFLAATFPTDPASAATVASEIAAVQAHGDATWETTAASVAGAAVNATAINGSALAAQLLALVYAGIQTGTAQAGGASSITLASGASGTDNFYANQAIFLLSGTGAGQTNKIASYVGATKVATVETPWVVQPDNTSVYVPLGRIG